jgi:hypothetical protein
MWALRRGILSKTRSVVNTNVIGFYYSGNHWALKQRAESQSNYIHDRYYATISPLKYKFIDKATRIMREGMYVLIVAGVFVTVGSIMYVLGKSLWEERHIQSLYDDLSKKLLIDADIIEALGDPIQPFRDRKGVSKRLPIYRIEYRPNDGKKRLTMQFFLIGSKHHAIVDAEFEELEETWKEYLILVSCPGANFSKYLARPTIPKEESSNSLLHWLFGRLNNHHPQAPNTSAK